MKAVGYQHSDDGVAPLQDIELATPEISGADILVQVKAVSVNPVDLKIHKATVPPPGEWKVLGWDGAGIVADVGPEVTLFKKGDAVWYAGAVNRPGSNSEFQLVHEHLAAIMPTSLSFAQAAALPLTAVTAWELLFDRLGLAPQHPSARVTVLEPMVILIIGAAGGVGSALVQFARQLTNLKIIGTTSQPANEKWIKELGAHEVIDHTKPLADELKRIGANSPHYIASLSHTDQHFVQMADIIAPQGKIALIDDVKNVDVSLLKRKSVSLHWEFMFTRSLFNTDMIAQHTILSKLSELVDQGFIHSTGTEHFGFINAENVTRAHQQVATGSTKGKIVLESFAEY